MWYDFDHKYGVGYKEDIGEHVIIVESKETNECRILLNWRDLQHFSIYSGSWHFSI